MSVEMTGLRLGHIHWAWCNYTRMPSAVRWLWLRGPKRHDLRACHIRLAHTLASVATYQLLAQGLWKAMESKRLVSRNGPRFVASVV